MIAVPIILNIIDDTKKSSVERSKELYIHAVEIAILNKNLNENFNPSICTVIEKGNLSCDVGELKVEVNGQVPKVGGTVTIKDGEVIGNTLEFEGGVKEDTPKETIGKAVTEDNKTIAGNIPQGNYEPGDEYIVNVDGEHEYHFYVLNTAGDKVNLIMSRNICSDGTLATVVNNCSTLWAPTANNGPVTAMNYLHETTKNWSNIENIQMSYTDEGNGYGGITTSGNTTTITNKDGVETERYNNLKARLIKISEIQAIGCTSDGGSCPAWIVNGLIEYSKYPEGTKENIDGINEYWTLSSVDGLNAVSIYFRGTTITRTVTLDNIGIRPVIEVLKTDLS